MASMKENEKIFINPEQVDEKTAKRLGKLIEKKFNGYWNRKRLFDLVVATLLLLITLPVSIIVMLAILIDDPKGSPIFVQKRIGRHGRVFNFYKFRTMVVNAESLKKDLMDQNEMDGPVFKITKDPRITRIGGFLRRTSLDELPQFLNVFLGDMSVVGPRPPLPSEFEQFSSYHKLKMIVTPGITCTWQIAHKRNSISFDRWVEMDLEYIENRTTIGDLMIIARTPSVMFRQEGK